MSPQEPTRLNSSQLTMLTFKTAWRNAGAFSRIALLPMVIYYAFNRLPIMIDAGHTVGFIGAWVLLTAYAVGCHRIVLLEKSQEGAPMSVALGAREFRYIAYTILIGIITGPIILIVYGVSASTGWLASAEGQGGPTTPGSGILIILLLLAVLFITTRLSLTLPGVAKDNPTPILANFKQAWQASSKGVWAMIITMLMVIFAVFIPMGMLGGMAASTGLITIDMETKAMIGPVAAILDMVLSFVLNALMATMLSCAYLKLVEGEE